MQTVLVGQNQNCVVISLSSTSLIVEKLKGEGFPTWQTKMQLLLMNEVVWEVINESEVDATDDLQQPKVATQCPSHCFHWALLGKFLNSSCGFQIDNQGDLEKLGEPIW